MPDFDKKAICHALVAAMQKEELHTREAAKYLNLNPCYLSMAQNPNSWDAMGKAPWIRLQEWFENREPLSEFSIPEGEEIWKPKEKTTAVATKVECKKIQKSYRKIMEAHDKAVIGRNEMDHKSLDTVVSTTEPTISLAYYKEQSDKVNAAMRLLSEENEKLRAIIHEHPGAPKDIISQRLALDIEINLIINGKRIQL